MKLPESVARLWSAVLRGIRAGFASPWMSMAEAVMAILTGLVGSLFANELREQIAALLGVRPVVTAVVTTPESAALASEGMWSFWILLAITAFIHVTRTQLASTRDAVAKALAESRQVAAQNRLEQAVAKTEDAVSTSPPPDYLQILGSLYENARTAAGLVRTSDERAHAIRIVLRAVAKLAKRYDQRILNDANVYVANLMWFIPSKDAAGWDGLVAFRAGGTTLTGVRGVLALAAQFSASNEQSPDPASRDFALDIPLNCGAERTKWRALPGAPMAFHRRNFEHFHPAVDIREWFDSYGDFAPSIKSQVSDYFTANTEIAGFMSLPIYVPSANMLLNEQREVLGILNVHWSSADLLSNGKSARKLSETLYPFLVLLAEQMIAFRKERTIEPGSGAAP